MSLLTDKDILKLLGKDIVIEPFQEKDGLTPVGYDFHIGEFVYSLEKGLLEPENGSYTLPAESTVQILTRESLWVSKRIAGLFHSKVSLVSKGLSHIATTLDPNWYGPLLITMRNNNKKPFKIQQDAAFVTLVMFKVSTPTETPHHKPSHRRDIILNQFRPHAGTRDQLERQYQRYMEKVQTLVDLNAMQKFEEAVKVANSRMIDKISASVRGYSVRKLLRGLGFMAVYALIALLISLQFYWNDVKFIFNNIPYDSTVLVAQVATTLAIVTILLEYRHRSS